MSLIDRTYFVNEISLPAVRETAAVGSDKILAKLNGDSLDSFIEEYEEKFLHLLFGEPFTDAFLTGLNLPEGNPEKEKWNVLKSKLCVEKDFYKESPIAYYVYRFYLLHLRDNVTATGNKKSKSTFADNVADTRRLVASWNKMVKFNKRFIKWFEINFDKRHGDGYSTYKSYWAGHIVDNDIITPINGMNL